MGDVPNPSPDALDAHHDEGEHQDVVELSPQAIEAARIRVGPAQQGQLSESLSLPGRVVLDPQKESLVSAWIAGQVDRIQVRSGERVKKGQQLAQVQSPELGVAVAAFRTATARDLAADARLERLQALEKDGVSSRAQVLEAEADHAEAEGEMEAAEERLRVLGVPMAGREPHSGEHFPSRIPVRSPISGTVLTADVGVGEQVAPGQALFRVGDLDQVWLLIDVFESDLSRVHAGQQVVFTVQAWPGERFAGPVDQVGDWLDPKTRSVQVRVLVENPEHKLKPNMYAQAELSEGEGGPSGVLLPASAVVSFEGGRGVFVESPPGHFAFRAVKIQSESSDSVLLAEGLELGEALVLEGAWALKSELEKSELGEGHAH
ncbi:MAG: cobalt-zinc-cadmium efflux system membrane fusion protein [Cognaticolwellia sp.]